MPANINTTQKTIIMMAQRVVALGCNNHAATPTGPAAHQRPSVVCRFRSLNTVDSPATATSHSAAVRLNDGAAIPVLGLGVFKADAGDACRSAVLSALQLGYRHIDTAQIYGNEAAVGEAVRASGLPRAEVFVTSKVR